MTKGRDSSPLVGIVGGGQLGRMLALAGLPLGFRFRFLEPSPSPPVRDLGEVIQGGYDDPEALDRFGDGLDAVTFEFENVPAAAVARLESRVPVFPPSHVLAKSQDRLVEKETFQRAGIAVADFQHVDTLAQLEAAAVAIGLPAVIKTRTLGYDGKGQWLLRDVSQARAVWQEAGGVPLLLEAFVPFTRELSVLAVRSRSGETACYPVVQNEHREGVLRTSRAPIPDLPPSLEEEAKAMARRLADDLGHVGVLAVELFQVGDALLANELAPRVHNSGHWTQDGAVTSQFENHLRAVTGLPLGSTEARGWSAMVNLLGVLPPLAQVLEIPGVHVHLYGKEPRPGRKVGHINVVRSSPEEVQRIVTRVRECVPD